MNQPICKKTYCNYGSYLNSRGYNKESCNIINNIQNGNITIGTITPGNCDFSIDTTIEGNVNIKSCPDTTNNGILKVSGGDIGNSTDENSTLPNILIESQNFGIQSNTGIKSIGPIVQITDCSHSNYFSAGNHIFTSINDCSANVTIKGNINVSENATFTKNPTVSNTINSSTRNLTNFGESITIIDISNNSPYVSGVRDLLFNSIIYSNVDNSTNIFNNSIIDFSNNQSYFQNSIIELYYNVNTDFGNAVNSVSVALQDLNSNDQIVLDTRSIHKNLGVKSIVFGPKVLVFIDGTPDNNYLSKQWKVVYDICGGIIETTDEKIIIKQKSLY